MSAIGIFFARGPNFITGRENNNRSRNTLFGVCPNPPSRSKNYFYKLYINEHYYGCIRNDPYVLNVLILSNNN